MLPITLLLYVNNCCCCTDRYPAVLLYTAVEVHQPRAQPNPPLGQAGGSRGTGVFLALSLSRSLTILWLGDPGRDRRDAGAQKKQAKQHHGQQALATTTTTTSIHTINY